MAAGAVEYLKEGRTALASTDFETASGGAGSGFADDAYLVIQTPGKQIITGATLDQSALGTSNGTDGPFAVDVLAPFAGDIAAESDTGLIVAISGDAYSELAQNSRLRYWPAGGRMKYSSGSGVCQLMQLGGSGRMFVVGGEVTYLIAEGGGPHNFNTSVVFTDAGRLSLCLGSGTIETHASDLIGMINVTGGNWTIKRGGVASTGILSVEAGTVNLDCGNAAWPKIRVTGSGVLNWISGAAPGTTVPTGAAEADVEFRGGTVNFRGMTRDVSITCRDYPTCTIQGAGNPKLTLTRYKQGSGAKLTD